MLDSNGSNTTAVAAVVKIEETLGDLTGKKVLILAGTGPVGQRAAGLLAKDGADVTITSRKPEQGEKARQFISARFSVQVEAVDHERSVQAARNCWTAWTCCSTPVRPACRWCPKAAWTGVEDARRSRWTSTPCPRSASRASRSTTPASKREGVVVFGAFGVGNFKTKLHKACVARLFTRNDLVLDAEAIAGRRRGSRIGDGRKEDGESHAARRGDRPGHGQPRRLRPRRRPALPRSQLADRRALADPRPAGRDLLAGSGSVPIWWPARRGTDCRSVGRREASEDDLRLAFLAPPDETGGIGGLRRSRGSSAPRACRVVYTARRHPSRHRAPRIGSSTGSTWARPTSCAPRRWRSQERERTAVARPDEVSLILLELGGAFTAGVAVERGQIVDGLGGTSGPIGWRAPGALDGEVAYLAEHVSKAALFQGGVASMLEREPGRRAIALDAYIEGAVKAVRQLRCSAPSAGEILLSGRKGTEPDIVERLSRALADLGPVRQLRGFAAKAKQGAQGAALLADGLSGGTHAGWSSG